MDREKLNRLKTVAALALLLSIILIPFIKTLMSLQPCEFTGLTMGTFYNIKITGSDEEREKAVGLKDDIDNLLAGINNQMSTYIPESEISRFNASGQTNSFTVSAELAQVVKFALDVAAGSGGAFDPTVGPLTLLWGFGNRGPVVKPPSSLQVMLAKNVSGYGHLSVDRTVLRKDIAGLELDLGAVAKGYGVDRVMGLLRDNGCSNALVEIGGEIVTLGLNDSKVPWRISIETPNYDAGIGESRYRILQLSGKAVATSGDYRSYFSESGQNYSHIIDPRTGWPVSNGVASVSVIADDCMTADALATALMVMGPDEGMKLLGEYSGAEAMFIMRDPAGLFSDLVSDGFENYVVRSEGEKGKVEMKEKS